MAASDLSMSFGSDSAILTFGERDGKQFGPDPSQGVTILSNQLVVQDRGADHYELRYTGTPETLFTFNRDGENHMTGIARPGATLPFFRVSAGPAPVDEPPGPDEGPAGGHLAPPAWIIGAWDLTHSHSQYFNYEGYEFRASSVTFHVTERDSTVWDMSTAYVFDRTTTDTYEFHQDPDGDRDRLFNYVYGFMRHDGNSDRLRLTVTIKRGTEHIETVEGFELTRSRP